MEKKRRKRRRASRAWLLIAVILGILILGDLNRRMTHARQLERDARQLATEVASLEAQNRDLETQVAGATSEAMIEEWARSEGRMVREGERLVIPVPAEGETPTVGAEAQEPREPPSNWEVWWALLFGN